jgi:hypothetical protein
LQRSIKAGYDAMTLTRDKSYVVLDQALITCGFVIHIRRYCNV